MSLQTMENKILFGWGLANIIKWEYGNEIIYFVLKMWTWNTVFLFIK